jgi:dephospho-CoA kinase
MKKVIWLTGRSGSGKSVAANCFLKAGCEVIDADKISRKIMDIGTPAYNDVAGVFGTEILHDDKTINRKKLGDIVFSDKEKLLVLNDITHKYIYTEIKRRITSSSRCIVVVDAPLLPNDDMVCHYILVVTVPDEIRLKRIMARDGLSAEQAKLRLKSQKTDDEYIKKAHYVLENKGEVNELEKNVYRFIESIKE